MARGPVLLDARRGRSHTPTPNAAEAIKHLEESGRDVFFLSNSSGRARPAMRDHLASVLGMPGLREDQIVPSCFAAASFLASSRPDVTKAFVVGGQGITNELAAHGSEAMSASDPTPQQQAQQQAQQQQQPA